MSKCPASKLSLFGDGGLTPKDIGVGYYSYEFVLDPIEPLSHRPGNGQYMPCKEQVEFGITLRKVLRASRRLYQETLASLKPGDPQSWAFEVAIRKAYARERYFRHYARTQSAQEQRNRRER